MSELSVKKLLETLQNLPDSLTYPFPEYRCVIMEDFDPNFSRLTDYPTSVFFEVSLDKRRNGDSWSIRSISPAPSGGSFEFDLGWKWDLKDEVVIALNKLTPREKALLNIDKRLLYKDFLDGVR
jgi:hypothetical protein